jgi:hypothetical protein
VLGSQLSGLEALCVAEPVQDGHQVALGGCRASVSDAEPPSLGRHAPDLPTTSLSRALG